MLTDVHVPTDLASAAQLVAAGGTVLGGGTHLMPRLNDYASEATALVSLRRAGLTGIQLDGTAVRIGAATTLSTIEHHAGLGLLNPVVRSIASVPVRTLATVGGNLFVPQPYGDLAVALIALRAQVTVVELDETRVETVEQVSAADSFRGVVTEVGFVLPANGNFRFCKAARRRFNSASIVTVAAVVEQSDGAVSAASVALGGVGRHSFRAHAVEQALLGRPLDEPSVQAAAEAAADELSPFDDAYASAWYRRRVFPVHLRRALLGR